MSRSTIPIFLLLITLAASDLTTAAASRYIHQLNPFLHNSYRSTRYPALCETSLEVYVPAVNHSPRQLAHAALSVSAAHAAVASSFVHRLTAGSKTTKSRSSVAVSDCIETLSDSVDRLKQIPFYPPQQSFKDFSTKVCENIIFKLVGWKLEDVEVVDIKPWVMHAEVAEKFVTCNNRVVLVGDAAHRFPPAGGFVCT